MNQRLTLSVVIVARNDETVIARAVESALRQETDFDFEIVVCDDCSSDRTRDVLSSLEQNHPGRIRLRFHDERMGFCHSLASGLNASAGRYAAFLEASDYWTDPTKLKQQVEYLDQHADCVLCYHKVREVDESGNDLGKVVPENPNTFLTLTDLLEHSGEIPSCAIVVRQSALAELPERSFCPNLGAWPFLLLYALGGKIGRIDDVLAARRLRRDTFAASRPDILWRKDRLRVLRQLQTLVDDRQSRQLDRASLQIRQQLARHHAMMSDIQRGEGNERGAYKRRIISFGLLGWNADLPLRERFSLSLRPYRGLHVALAKAYYGVCGFFRSLWATLRIGTFALRYYASDWRSVVRFASRVRASGFRGFPVEAAMLHLAYVHRPEVYRKWYRLRETLTDADRQAIRHHISLMRHRPLVSVLMPVFNTPEEWLRKAIDSVRDQIYPSWELSIADDASTDPHVRCVLEEYRERDSRIMVEYRATRGHISTASNSALEPATGEYLALLDHDDELTEHALYMLAHEINQHPDADIIYSDEDKIDVRGRLSNPYFKTDWNPDLMLSNNMLCHLAVYRTALVREIGGFQTGLEGSQDHDLALRCAAQTRPARIRHIPHVLYHWRETPASTATGSESKDYAYHAGVKAIESHLERKGVRGQVELETDKSWINYRIRYELPADLPRVSVIIPTKDQVSLLSRTVDGVLQHTDYDNLDLMIIDNQSEQAETHDYFRLVAQDPRVRILKYDRPFNYAAMNNMAARAAEGSVLCLLNNDIEVIEGDWLREMVSHALRPEVGAVGAKLLYPDDAIQHAGVINGIHGLAGHIHRRIPNEIRVPFARTQVVQNFSAVTAGCMVLRRSVFEEVGMFDEKTFAVRYNDVDLCLRIVEAGYWNVWTPYAVLYHWESASVGKETEPEKQKRFQGEADALRRRWRRYIENDPLFNPNLSLSHVDYRQVSVPRVGKPWRDFLSVARIDDGVS
jgi:glycosyltransferase involved in cell wall biosynthesis